MMTTGQRPTEPLGAMVRVFWASLLGLTALGLVLAATGRGVSFGGFGDATVCVDQPRTTYGGGSYPPGVFPTARPGVTLMLGGTLRACAGHPGVASRLLYTLTAAPGLIWLGVLFLLWRLVRFTGWFIIIGGLAAISAQGAATDALLGSMLKVPAGYGDAIPASGWLLPVLAGVTALTFARFVRRGVVLTEEVEGTI